MVHVCLRRTKLTKNIQTDKANAGAASKGVA